MQHQGRRSIRVFEHETLVVGQRRRAIDGSEVVVDRATVDALVRLHDDRGGGLLQVGHRSVRFQHWVGFVQVGSLGIEVLPKADRGGAGGERERARWHDVLVTLLRVAGGRVRTPSAASLALHDESLVDLVAAWFLDELEPQLQEGLPKRYRDIEGDRRVLRGRLLFAQHLRRNLVRADRLYVAHTTYDRDTPLNRVLRAALVALGDAALHARTEARRRRALFLVPETTRGTPSEPVLARIRFDRSTERLRPAYELARTILAHHAPRPRAGSASLMALLFDVHALWERYVDALVRRAAGRDVRVAAQSSHAFWRSSDASRRGRPDLVLRGPGGPPIVLDCKWKDVRAKGVTDADLRQMFAYGAVLGTDRTMLVYPEVGEGPLRVTGRFAAGERTCELRTFPPPGPNGSLEAGRAAAEELVDPLRAPRAAAPPGTERALIPGTRPR